jgi:hypothetical protein
LDPRRQGVRRALACAALCLLPLLNSTRAFGQNNPGDGAPDQPTDLPTDETSDKPGGSSTDKPPDVLDKSLEELMSVQVDSV